MLPGSIKIVNCTAKFFSVKFPHNTILGTKHCRRTICHWEHRFRREFTFLSIFSNSQKTFTSTNVMRLKQFQKFFRNDCIRINTKDRTACWAVYLKSVLSAVVEQAWNCTKFFWFLRSLARLIGAFCNCFWWDWCFFFIFRFINRHNLRSHS
jgi:hypothetical protein